MNAAQKGLMLLLAAAASVWPLTLLSSAESHRQTWPGRVSAIGQIRSGPAQGMRYRVRLGYGNCGRRDTADGERIQLRRYSISLLRRHRRTFLSQLRKWEFVPSSPSQAIATLSNQSKCYHSKRGYSSFASVFEETYPYENPHHTVSAAVFSGEQKAKVGLHELFKHSDFERALVTISDFSRAHLRAQLLGDDHEPGAMAWIEQGTLPREASFSTFVVTESGLKVHFQEYQVTSYAHGIREVLIPWQVLEHFLSRCGEASIASDSTDVISLQNSDACHKTTQHLR